MDRPRAGSTSRSELSRSGRTPVWQWLLLALLLAAALLGSWHGGTHLYLSHDEPLAVNPALRMLARRQLLLPETCLYPPLYIRTLAGAYALTYAAGRGTGLVTDELQMRRLAVQEPGWYHFIGRVVSALCYVTAAWVCARMARPIAGGRAAGLVILTFLATPIGYEAATSAKPDAMQLLWVCAALAMGLHVTGQRDRDPASLSSRSATAAWAGAGFLGAAAVATKLYGGAVLAGLLLLALLPSTRRKRSLLALLLGAVAGLALLGFDTLAHLAQHTGIANLTNLRQSAHPWMNPTLADRVVALGAEALRTEGWSIPWIGLAGLGLLTAPRAVRLASAGLILANLAVVLIFHVVELRYLLPCLPCLALGVACAARRVECLSAGPRRCIRAALLVALLLGVVPVSLEMVRRCGPDTRDQAKDWIESSIPAGTLIAYDHSFAYNPPLTYPNEFLPNHADVWRQFPPEGPTYRAARLRNLGPPPPRTAGAYDLRFCGAFKTPSELQAEGVRYVLLSSWVLRTYEPDAPLNKEARAYFRSLVASPDVTLVREWSPRWYGMGPTITLRSVEPAPERR